MQALLVSGYMLEADAAHQLSVVLGPDLEYAIRSVMSSNSAALHRARAGNKEKKTVTERGVEETSVPSMSTSKPPLLRRCSSLVLA